MASTPPHANGGSSSAARADARSLSRRAMAFVLAGGRGSRLQELTDRRAKPAVYFGGKTRIIDFALSNALNSGIRRIGVATQYKAHSLIRHLQRGWNFLRTERNESFDILPASQRVSENQWYLGTADAIFQNIDIIEDYQPEYIVVLAGDHVYKMDYAQMLAEHVDKGADVTVGCLLVPRMEATGFGVMQVDEHDTIVQISRKAGRSAGHAGAAGARAGERWASTCSAPTFSVRTPAPRRGRARVEPRLRQGPDPVARRERQGGRAPLSRTPACKPAARKEAYWRDVGTVDAYWQANIDLTDFTPALDIYDRDWPIWTYAEITPPAKFIHNEEARRGIGGKLDGLRRLHHLRLHGPPRSLLFTGVHAHSFSELDHAVVLPYASDRSPRAAVEGRHRPRRAHSGRASSSARTPELDAKRFRRTEGGVCLITKPMMDALDT